ncbi:MAG: hypothetical protein RLZZ234_483 [Candidatus Parcubacteria bacterium]|jgi:hypothetical protein
MEKNLKIAAASLGLRTQHRPRDTSCAPNRPNALPKKTTAEREDEEALRTFNEHHPRTYQGES